MIIVLSVKSRSRLYFLCGTHGWHQFTFEGSKALMKSIPFMVDKYRNLNVNNRKKKQCTYGSKNETVRKAFGRRSEGVQKAFEMCKNYVKIAFSKQGFFLMLCDFVV